MFLSLQCTPGSSHRSVSLSPILSLPFLSSPCHPLDSSVFSLSSPSGCSLRTPCRYHFGLWLFDLCLSSRAWEVWDWALAASLDEETHEHRSLRDSPLYSRQQQSQEQGSLLIQVTHPALEERAGNPLLLTATGPWWARKHSKVHREALGLNLDFLRDQAHQNLFHLTSSPAAQPNVLSPNTDL